MNIDKDENKSFILWSIITVFVLFLFLSPFKAALFNGGSDFYAGPLYSFITVTGVLLLLLALFIFYYRKIEFKNEILNIAVWILPLLYTINFAFFAASKKMAFFGILLNITYVVFFILASYLARSRMSAKVLSYLLVYCGYAFVILGLCYWFGNLKYRDAVLGYRLSNVFQYPNTYSAYLVFIALSSLVIIADLVKKRYFFMHSLMLVPIMTSFFLTYSRGVFISFALSIIMLLPLLNIKKQLNLLINLLLSTFLSLIIMTPISNIGAQIIEKENVTVLLSIKGWGLVILVSVIGALISTIISSRKFFLEEDNNKNEYKFNYRRLIAPIAILCFVCLSALILLSNIGKMDFLPTVLKKRIESISSGDSSILARNSFYTDSLKVVKEHPILGVGHGAWQTLYEKYQSYPYISRQTHNFFLQLLTETGVVGISLFLIFLIVIYSVFVKKFFTYRRITADLVFFSFSTAILTHSMLDFDMSFVYLAALVFFSLGAMSSIQFRELEKKKYPIKSIQQKYNKINYVYIAAMLVVSVFLIVVSVRSQKSIHVYSSAVSKENKGIEEFARDINNALSLQYENIDYILTLISAYTQVYQQTKDDRYYNEAYKLIDRSRDKEPYNLGLVNAEVNLLLLKGKSNTAFELLNSKKNNYYWNINISEQIIQLGLVLGIDSKAKNEISQMNYYWEIVQREYYEVLSKINQLSKFSKETLNGTNEYKLTSSIILSTGQVLAYQHKYEESSKLLQLGLNENIDLKENREIMLWYLVTLKKQQKEDTNVYNKLINKYPEDKLRIEQLILQFD